MQAASRINFMRHVARPGAGRLQIFSTTTGTPQKHCSLKIKNGTRSLAFSYQLFYRCSTLDRGPFYCKVRASGPVAQASKLLNVINIR
jgi:hypothetical protein